MGVGGGGEGAELGAADGVVDVFEGGVEAEDGWGGGVVDEHAVDD